MKFDAGPNATRIKDKGFESLMYTTLNMEEDLSQADGGSSSTLESPPIYFTEENDLVIGMVKGRCTVVASKNSCRCLNSNFAKCAYDPNRLDPWFFAYWFNESEEAQFQKHIDFGKALAPMGLEMLTISLPSLEKQKKIGLAYKRLKHLEYLLDQKKNDLSRLSEQVIRNTLKGN